MKRLRNQMNDEGVAAAAPIPSFLIECLVWNADLSAFERDSFTDVIRHALADLWNNTRKEGDCSEWGEVNERKYLFRAQQPWTRQQVNDFLQSAWDYIGYK